MDQVLCQDATLFPGRYGALRQRDRRTLLLRVYARSDLMPALYVVISASHSSQIHLSNPRVVSASA